MNATSLVLSLLVYGLVVLLTVGIHFGARCPGVWSDRRRRWTCGLLLIGGALFSGFVYATDSQLRATTLHELVFQPQDTHTYETAFDVESPGVQHEPVIMHGFGLPQYLLGLAAGHVIRFGLITDARI